MGGGLNGRSGSFHGAGPNFLARMHSYLPEATHATRNPKPFLAQMHSYLVRGLPMQGPLISETPMEAATDLRPRNPEALSTPKAHQGLWFFRERIHGSV